MWGAGGRNIMAFLNELKGLTSSIVDSDEKRIGSKFGNNTIVEKSSVISDNDEIICLNKLHLEFIKNKFIKNKILTIK